MRRRSASRRSTSRTSSCNQWTALRATRTRARPSPTAWRIRAGACRCNRTRSWGSASPMEIAYRFGFDAAHRFGGFPEGHPYAGVHGHSFQVEVALEGEPDPATGFVADFGEVERACGAVRAALDHRMLNEVGGLASPSLENLCLFVW